MDAVSAGNGAAPCAQELCGVHAVGPLHINAPRAAEARHLLRRTAQLRPKPRLIEDPPAGLRRCLAAERKEIGKHDTLLPLYRMRRPRDPPRFGRIIFIQKRFINILDISLSRCKVGKIEARPTRVARSQRSRDPERVKGEAAEEPPPFPQRRYLGRREKILRTVTGFAPWRAVMREHEI